MRDENTLVVVQGRVVQLTSRFTPLLAGPVAWRMGQHARRLLSLIAGVVPWLAGQHEATRLLSSRPRAARSPHLSPSRPGASSGVGVG